MNNTTQSFAHTAMLIRKPVNDVFNAFINPEVTTHFWFTQSTGLLTEGAHLVWTWGMYNLDININVLTIVPNKLIEIQWGDDADSIVKWEFEEHGSDKTFVSITNTGIKGNNDEILAQVRDSTGGFSWVLAGLKAYLEHSIELNLTADRHP